MKSRSPIRVFLTVLTLAATLVAFGACQNTGSSSSGASAPAAGTGPGSHPNKNTDTGAGPGVR